jgi:hypothetical protein
MSFYYPSSPLLASESNFIFALESIYITKANKIVIFSLLLGIIVVFIINVVFTINVVTIINLFVFTISVIVTTVFCSYGGFVLLV